MAAVSLSSTRIVIIDDHRDLAENLREILTDEGAHVVVATHADAGLRAAQAGFDVALVDVRLPDAPGLTLVPLLRAIDPSATVVLITGHASIDDAIAAVRAGAHGYVLEPFDTPDLLGTVARAAEHVRLERRAGELGIALTRREAELRTLVESVAALLLVLDEDGLIVQANPAVAVATGAAPSELPGLPWAQLFVPASDRGPLLDACAEIRSGASGIELEGRVLHHGVGGVDERIVRWRLAGLPGPDGFRIYASGLDVTDVRGLERRTRLAEKLAAVGTFSAGLAHEIRNPLNGATLQLQLLEHRLAKLDEPEAAAAVAEPLGLVRAELDRLSRLVADFLAFARPVALRTADVELVAAMARLAELERPVAAARGCTLELLAPEGPVIVEADAERIEQIMLNLIRNAIEAANTRVVVAVTPDGAGARIEVQDDGPGIEPAQLARIFEPFFTTKAAGTGLGLAIAHSLVARHGGSMDITCDGITRVGVLLPRSVP